MKRFAEALLVRSGCGALIRTLQRSPCLVLVYHNVVSDDAPRGGDASLHVRRTAFSRHLDCLRRTHDVVGLAELFASPNGRSLRPRVAITFDDAYRGAVLNAVPELVARQLSATIFVAPALLGSSAFWWDELLSGTDHVSLRAYLLRELGGVDRIIRARAAELGLRPVEVPPEACPATVEELDSAASHSGITVASHSWSHSNLTTLSRQALYEELGRSHRWLADRYGERVIPFLAYPYGISTRTVEYAARAARYRAAFLADGGWMPHRPRRLHALPRMAVPAGVSVNGFRLRVGA